MREKKTKEGRAPVSYMIKVDLIQKVKKHALENEIKGLELQTQSLIVETAIIEYFEKKCI